MTTQTSETEEITLTLPEELILMLLNPENGYFHQVPGWDLNCVLAGAVLAELSMIGRIDTDLDSLFLIDATETGDPCLDPFLKAIAEEEETRDTRYWVEKLAPRAERVVDMTLERLVDMKILEQHAGEFWTLARNAQTGKFGGGFSDGTLVDFVKTRIARQIFEDEIPDPRDAILISLIDSCDVFRFMFQLEEEQEERIKLIRQTALIGRTIAEAVSENIAIPFLQRSALSDRPIPRVPLRKLIFNKHVRTGNLAALLADIAEEYGPVFEIRPPFQEPMIFLAGVETNRWVHTRGRMYLRSRDYISDFEKVYGASGVLPALDGADHFRMRKALAPSYSRKRVSDQLDDVYGYIRNFISDWKVGDAYPATNLSRLLINSQLSKLFIGVDTQDMLEDVVKFKERALMVHVTKMLPAFTLKTPAMRRRLQAVEDLLVRVRDVHTPAQRAGQHRDLVDDLLSLHASDPQFAPESNMKFTLSAALIASVYMGDGLSFALYGMASQPEIQKQIQEEADALFANGDPDGSAFTPANMDVTHRFLMECLRIYPVVPVSMRHVMNHVEVEGHIIPVGAKVVIAQAATHFMEDVFPKPFEFDIDRYKPPRREHISPGYAPYGLGTHTCLGSRWMSFQMAVNVLTVAHYFTLGISPANYKLRFNPFPSMKPSKNLKFLIKEKRRELPK